MSNATTTDNLTNHMPELCGEIVLTTEDTKYTKGAWWVKVEALPASARPAKSAVLL